MATSQEEIRIRMGLDAASVNASTNSLLDRQKKAALEYVEFWEGALKKREASEVATAERIKNETLAIEREKNIQSIALARATALEKAAVNKAFFEEQAAQSAISQGSGGFSWMGSGEIKEGEKVAAKGLKELGHEAHGNSTAFREIFVLIREGLRGNFSRMIGSASILAGSLGALAAVVTGLIVTLPITLFVGYKFEQMRKAQAAAKESEKETQSKVGDTAANLRQEIEALKKHGLIDSGEADVYLDKLKHPEYQDVSYIQGQVNKYMPKGGRAALMAQGFESDSDKIKKIDEVSKKEQAELDAVNNKKRDSKQLEADIAEKKEWVFKITRQIGWMEADHQQNTLSYHEALEKKIRYQLELQKDLTEQQKQKADAQKESDRQERESEKSAIASAQVDKEYPSMEQLAGRRYVQQLNDLYGEHKVTYRRHGRRFTRTVHGQYDLESGDGAYAGIAQDFLLAQKQQVWDLEHGNNVDANNDRLRMIADRTKLVNAGVASPEQLLGKIGDDTGKLKALFQSLVDAGVIVRGSDS